MNAIVRRFVVGASAATFIGAASVLGAGAAQAQDPFCWANQQSANTAFSQCSIPVWHQVHIRCWSGSGSYERAGNPMFWWDQSWASCDWPFGLEAWWVSTF
ncbi:hypothetical protein D5S18_32580 [Nocardia panacis]|uniref:Secreted protein n=1 Tax=Nocardia panacis TaxID=2340916 RepID=A0A3A4K5J2_9NOCA|nr:hypothetical protein [Nocardia panacis]RJO68180.1 hypothetical protein D5S18_32580 [Nocardia panacis]